MSEKKLTIPWEGKDKAAVRVDFESTKESWNYYDLEDGTRLKLKTVVTAVVRLEGEYRPTRDPIYLVKSANIVEVEVPEHLKLGSVKPGEAN